MNDERLAEIEIKLTYQEDLVQELNTQVYRQQQRIEHLEKLCQSLVEHLRGLTGPASSRSLLDEIPPHY
jgi:SlyX protein